ncbi:MAG: hypothetical protein JO149_03945 [Gammaproteobacteria bacterium]|nr:hypothetical protein [Gammaproteobacteria bacterium]
MNRSNSCYQCRTHFNNKAQHEGRVRAIVKMRSTLIAGIAAVHLALSIEHVMKILIIGSPGAGKTEFSKRLAQNINVPLFHLDDYYWQENWQRPSAEKWHAQLQQLLNHPAWIIDGNYYDSLQIRLTKADYVIYLDYSVLLCLFRAFKRTIIRRFVRQTSLPLAVRKNKNYPSRFAINWKFIKLILFFKLNYRKKIFTLLNQCKVNVKVLTSSKDMQFFIDNLCIKK